MTADLGVEWLGNKIVNEEVTDAMDKLMSDWALGVVTRVDDGHRKLTMRTPLRRNFKLFFFLIEYELHKSKIYIQYSRPILFNDFLAAIHTCGICETWRGDDSELWAITLGHKLFFSGNCTHMCRCEGAGVPTCSWLFECFHMKNFPA